jgi:hypothetical protein
MDLSNNGNLGNDGVSALERNWWIKGWKISLDILGKIS